jgi:hypothetical protein
MTVETRREKKQKSRTGIQRLMILPMEPVYWLKKKKNFHKIYKKSPIVGLLTVFLFNTTL